MKLIHNSLQFVLCNASKWNYLESLRKGFIEKMTNLVEFWLILERDLVECAPHKMFDEMI